MSKEFIEQFANIQYPIVGDYNSKRYGNDRMNEWLRKQMFDVIKLKDGRLCGFDKESIKKDFCFADEGTDYEIYKDLHSDDEKFRDCCYIYDYTSKQTCKATYGRKDYFTYHDEIKREPICEEDRKNILEVLRRQKADMEKRLENWWKRYGKDCLHTWTYWRDA